jgi:phage terminase small subunit
VTPKTRAEGRPRTQANRKAREDVVTRQAIYIEEFIRHGNHAKAALAAGWGAGNERHAAQHASRLLKQDSEFRAALAARQAKVAKAMALETEQVLAQVAACVHSDIRRCFNADGTLKQIHELDDATAKAIASIKVETRMRGSGEDREPVLVAEVKFWSKVEMVDKAMKHLGLFERDNKQKATAIEELMTYVAANGRQIPIADQCSPSRTTLPTTLTLVGD